jgi:O-antigen ligase
VVRENLFGKTQIPAYGLFRHPNTFAGFLCIVLFWLLIVVPESRLATTAFVFGTIALLFTISYISLFVYILGIIFLVLIRSFNNKGKVICVFITAVVLIFSLTFPKLNAPSLKNSPSFYRRATLLAFSKDLIKQHFWFGVGVNNMTVFSKDLRFIYNETTGSSEQAFFQPVHNVFALVWAESGVFAVIFFVLFIAYGLKRSFSVPILFISLLQIVILSSFDHYFYTMQQTQLIFWLTMGIVYSYNLY